jgi:hypothetical protein
MPSRTATDVKNSRALWKSQEVEEKGGFLIRALREAVPKVSPAEALAYVGEIGIAGVWRYLTSLRSAVTHEWVASRLGTSVYW